MKSGLAAALLVLVAAGSQAQQRPELRVRRLTLPRELADPDNQFSGLYIVDQQLLLLSESRLQDRAEAKLYGLKLSDLSRQLTDTAYALPHRTFPIRNLEILRGKINGQHQVYEGLEALTMVGSTLYLSVETTTPSTNCYLLRGTLTGTAVVLDTTFLQPIPKPTFADGTHVYNAGFEALTTDRGRLFGFFEYNYFAGGSYAYQLPVKGGPGAGKALPIEPLPFRLTDITRTGRRRFTAINYFFQGGGEEAVYRTPDTDPANTGLIKSGTTYQSYCRLVTLRRRGRHFRWQPLADLPPRYMNYNWEGIAAYQNGYFLLNDKYTPARPYSSVLLYVQ
ncbi:hypothetical protein E5K00_00385 [Hymenobacter aquaticus]|uniref:DUF5103 domain-containing protein n=1 Tax=Hymenobacter aquaticus TaxID=1867101 RepID=A0A4Z0Q272_9BACT|nr:hypothetical protein [Hymenobacter aquaticus]TGE23704.1 hypothetical protein E5K00_00385 [Hymenobacter aquaticus]